MTQNILQVPKDGEILSIILGWDRPSQEYFALVLKGEDEDVLLQKDIPDNTDDSLTLMSQYLITNGYSVPTTMLETAVNDKLNPLASNTIRYFSSSGSLLREVSVPR